MVHRYELYQCGLMVATIEHKSKWVAVRAISHYKEVYALDGPCIVVRGRLQPWKKKTKKYKKTGKVI